MITGGIVAAVLVFGGGCAAYALAVLDNIQQGGDSPSTSTTAPRALATTSSPAVAAPTFIPTIAPTVPTTSPESVPFVGNPRCGESYDPSDESGTGGPPSSYLCAEENFLHKLAGDNVVVQDPIAAIKAGYDDVCAITGPSGVNTPGTLDANGRDLGEDLKAAQKAVLASGVVTTPGDAMSLVEDAGIELC